LAHPFYVSSVGIELSVRSRTIFTKDGKEDAAIEKHL